MKEEEGKGILYMLAGRGIAAVRRIGSPDSLTERQQCDAYFWRPENRKATQLLAG